MRSSDSLVEALDAHSRQDAGPPRRADAARTRAALLTAARAVFEDDGYVDAKISDITKRAGVAHGSFYSHFDGKADVLAAVLTDAAEHTEQPVPVPRTDGSDPLGRIEASNRAYLESYRSNARLMGLMEQVATVDKEFQALRLQRTERFIKRNARFIRGLQAEGHADPAIDPAVTAMTLSAMVSRAAYFAFVMGHPVRFESLVRTVNQVWARSLGLSDAR
jgi:AcrR family transcriptional regulator